jgi:NAD(P)-dependent dehydrogenase (short-subunit alcohol dehydrogenase family)
VQSENDAVLVDLAGEVALVTGASRGIGRATALALASAGAAVGLVARSHRDLATTAEAIRKAGGQSLICEADLNDFTVLESVIHAMLARWGKLDIVVNNAGVAPAEPPVTSDDFGAWESMVRLNLDCVFRLSRLAGRTMIAQRHGSIVNIGSIGGASALIAPQPGYCATKAALPGLTRALAAEWAPHGVRVNTVAPGYIATEMNMTTRRDQTFVESVNRRTPMARFGTADEVAFAVVFLASSRAAYITGQTLFVDGGWSVL